MRSFCQLRQPVRDANLRCPCGNCITIVAILPISRSGANVTSERCQRSHVGISPTASLQCLRRSGTTWCETYVRQPTRIAIEIHRSSTAATRPDPSFLEHLQGMDAARETQNCCREHHAREIDEVDFWRRGEGTRCATSH